MKTNYMVKYTFYFRTGKSIRKAITKITRLLWKLNNNKEYDSYYVLKIHNPVTMETYYENTIKFYEKYAIFRISILGIEKSLEVIFINKRLKILGNIMKDFGMEINTDKINSKECEKLRNLIYKGVPRTEIVMSLNKIDVSVVSNSINSNSNSINSKSSNNILDKLDRDLVSDINKQDLVSDLYTDKFTKLFFNLVAGNNLLYLSILVVLLAIMDIWLRNQG